MQFLFKKIDFVFFNEQKIRLARLDHIKPLLRNSSGLSDPTARDAIENLNPISQITICGKILKFPETWLNIVNKTYDWCKKLSFSLFAAVRRKYFSEHYLSICRDLHISVTTFHSFVNRARQYAALQAVQSHLIKI